MMGGLRLRILGWIFLVLLAAAPSMADLAVTEQSLREAARRAGVDPRELLVRSAAVKDSLAEPGRTSLPTEESAPQVILPGQLTEGSPALHVPEAAEEVSGSGPGDLFGSDFFKLGPELFQSPNFGPVPESYPIGVGDQIFIDVWGEVEFFLERVVDRDGTIILPKGGKILCAGRSLVNVESEVRRRLAQSYSGISTNGQGGNTFVSLSLGKLKAIKVFVVGEAARPGAYELGSLSTIFTALYAAGGPGATGSFREIKLIRNSLPAGELDLYDYLLEGKRRGDVYLRDGDTVYIPTRKRTVSLEGAVRRPRRFELADGENLGSLLRFGGGFTAEASPEILHLQRILPPGDRRPERPDRIQMDVDSAELGFELRDGDQIEVPSIGTRVENWVEIRGNVKRPGRYEYRPRLTVADLVSLAGGPWMDTLEQRALLDRIDENRRHLTLDFHLGRQLSGKDKAIELKPMDQLTVFSIWELTDRATVEISGAVRKPGSYEYKEGGTLRDLVLKAGGLLESADILNAEVFRVDRESLENRETDQAPERLVDVIKVPLGPDWLDSSQSFPLEPHDHVAIRKLPWWELQRKVTLRGELLFPGVYSLQTPDTRLSSVIADAGGLKPTADLLGARIERSRDGVGIVALELDKALAKPGGESDPILAAGDVITIPAVSHSVKVTGAVRYATSVTFSHGRSLKKYVEMAGGFAEGADKGKAYVVYPNGVSRPLRWFGLRQPKILPGSTIIVPWEKAQVGDGKLATLKEISSIFASLATVWLVIDRTK